MANGYGGGQRGAAQYNNYGGGNNDQYGNGAGQAGYGGQGTRGYDQGAPSRGQQQGGGAAGPNGYPPGVVYDERAGQFMVNGMPYGHYAYS